MQTSKADNRPAAAPLSIRYVDHLAATIAAGDGRTKGEERRLGLLHAAAEILQHGGYHDLRIADVIERAGVARGTFYIYFRDKSDIVLSVLADFRQTLMTTANLDLRGQSWEQRIYTVNLQFALLHEHNAGLMQAFRQLVDEAEDFRTLRHQTERAWARRQYAAWSRRFGRPATPQASEALYRRLHAMRAMTEHLCMQIYIERMPELVDLYPTAQDVARVCSDIWIATMGQPANTGEHG
jgi:AcrR family transcriptional regulator